MFIFRKIINLLNEIQSIKDKEIINFKNQNYKIPKYSSKILLEEAKLFSNWYSKQKLTQANQLKFRKDYAKVIKTLIKKISLKNDVLVHRDFHVSNLMLVNSKIGVIDTQDALIGNKAYDLASLIDDVRFRHNSILKEKLFNIYLKSQNKLNVKKFKNDFEILSVLRNLKVIGIFTRLAIRDGKKRYLNLIPYTWTLINTRVNENKIFLDLKNLLINNFKGKIE